MIFIYPWNTEELWWTHLKCLCIKNLKCWFMWREGNWITQRKTLRARTRTNSQLSALTTLGPGFEPWPHWWKVSAITTVPLLIPDKLFVLVNSEFTWWWLVLSYHQYAAVWLVVCAHAQGHVFWHFLNFEPVFPWILTVIFQSCQEVFFFY